ncbi:MAG: hypothetical protein K0R99_2531 [Microbacterium sp.]|jgi:hypothetical protein|nr:hypothetical protein [Microbacterium sp.]
MAGATATLVVMSEPQQPSAHLPAEPQYPTAAQHPAASQYPAAAQHDAAPPHPADAPAPMPGTHTFPTHASSAPPATPAASTYPTAYPTAAPAYPTAAPAAQAYPAGAPGRPASWPAAPRVPSASAGNGLGRTAFVIAVVTLAVNLLSSIVRLLIYTSDFGYGSAYAIDDAIGVISFFTYVVALVLGIIAARRPGPRLLAGIAIGIAGAGALGMIFSWVGIAFLRFV